MKKYLVALLIGIVATAAFGLLAGFGGGACHCDMPLRVLFPYMSLLGANAEEGILGTLLFGLQYPLYAVGVAMPRSVEWRMGLLLVLLVVHGCAVALAFQVSR